jgi:hypothetical protein
MPVTDIFSRRSSLTAQITPTEELTPTIRRQAYLILVEAVGGEADLRAKKLFGRIWNTLLREYDEEQLTRLTSTTRSERPSQDAVNLIRDYLLFSNLSSGALDVIELAFRELEDWETEHWFDDGYEIEGRVEDHIRELNQRFKMGGSPFRYERGKIVRLDSEYLHANVTKPALKMLSSHEYRGANEEFLAAHAHHRSGRSKECITECLKALESTLKAICAKRSWTYAPDARMRELVEICFTNGLIPRFWESYFSGLRACLESGVPTMRNRPGTAHGQGPAPIEVPGHYAAHALHLTASNIVFLAEAEKALP